ncbi:MAG: hypothetical protein S4CHLAM37_17080 [Chlamydiia bacterium]|nr:hypothetical protein [Chlamydiia bacterium]
MASGYRLCRHSVYVLLKPGICAKPGLRNAIKARIPALAGKARIPALAGNLWIEQQIAQTMDGSGQIWNLYRHASVDSIMVNYSLFVH